MSGLGGMEVLLLLGYWSNPGKSSCYLGPGWQQQKWWEVVKFWVCIHSWFLLFVVVILYEINVNTKLTLADYWIIALREDNIRSWIPLSRVTAFLTIDQYITLCFVCFCLKDTFFNVSCWLINIKLTASSVVIHDSTQLSNTYLLHKAHGRLLEHKSARQHFSTVVGDHFKQQNYQQKDH